MKEIPKVVGRKMLTKKDKHFFFSCNGIVFPRANFIVRPGCPAEHKKIIYEAERNGWIEAVAFISEKDLVWAELKRETL